MATFSEDKGGGSVGAVSVGPATLFEPKHGMLPRLRLMLTCLCSDIDTFRESMPEPMQALASFFFLSYWSQAAETASHRHRARWPTRYSARLRSSAEGRQRTKGRENSDKSPRKGNT